MNPTIRIAILEDDAPVRAQLAEAAAHCGEVVWQAASLTEARRLLAAGAPDILLVDVGLPDGNGLDIVLLACRSGHTQCLVVSVAGDEATVLRAIECGASGYLLKDAPPGEITRAIRDVVAGGAPITPRLAMFLLKRMRAGRTQDSENEPLTDREKEVLDGLARGLSYAELADAKHVSYHTINTHVKSIYRKLAVSSRNEAVYKALATGMVRIH